MIVEEIIQSPLGINVKDLERCHDVLGTNTWKKLIGSRIFLTGGTGFIGKWILASLLDANLRFSLNCTVTVLSRDPEAFLKNWPSL